MGDNISQLVLPNAGQQFKAKDFNDLMKPGVYVLLKNERPIYVGMGKILLRRISSLHHKRHFFEECDTILLHPCVNLQAALDLEEILISGLKPSGNKRRKYGLARKQLGLQTNHSILEVYGKYSDGPRKPRNS